LSPALPHLLLWDLQSRTDTENLFLWYIEADVPASPDYSFSFQTTHLEREKIKLPRQIQPVPGFSSVYRNLFLLHSYVHVRQFSYHSPVYPFTPVKAIPSIK